MAEQEFTKQNATEYEPTNAELKLLEVLVNPEHYRKSITDKCSIAGVDRTTYYRAYNKPGFRELVAKRAQDLVLEYVLPTIHAFGKQAMLGSFQHGETILEMANLYKKTTRQELTGKDGGPIKTETVNPIDYSNLTDDEVKILTENKAWVADPVKAKEIAQMLLTNKVNE